MSPQSECWPPWVSVDTWPSSLCSNGASRSWLWHPISRLQPPLVSKVILGSQNLPINTLAVIYCARLYAAISSPAINPVSNPSLREVFLRLATTAEMSEEPAFSKQRVTGRGPEKKNGEQYKIYLKELFFLYLNAPLTPSTPIRIAILPLHPWVLKENNKPIYPYQHRATSGHNVGQMRYGRCLSFFPLFDTQDCPSLKLHLWKHLDFQCLLQPSPKLQ